MKPEWPKRNHPPAAEEYLVRCLAARLAEDVQGSVDHEQLWNDEVRRHRLAAIEKGRKVVRGRGRPPATIEERRKRDERWYQAQLVSLVKELCEKEYPGKRQIHDLSINVVKQFLDLSEAQRKALAQFLDAR